MLGRFNAAETALVEKVLAAAADQVECWLNAGIQKAMNQFNGVVEELRSNERKRISETIRRFVHIETAGKEEGIKDTIDKISAEITSAGGKVETVQKMDKQNFPAWPTRSTRPAFT